MTEIHPVLALAIRQAIDETYEIDDHALVNPIVGGEARYVKRRLTAKEKMEALRAVLPFVVPKLATVDGKSLNPEEKRSLTELQAGIDALLKKAKKA